MLLSVPTLIILFFSLNVLLGVSPVSMLSCLDGNNSVTSYGTNRPLKLSTLYYYLLRVDFISSVGFFSRLTCSENFGLSHVSLVGVWISFS